MEEVLAMNELIFAGDREDEHVRNQMIILRRDLEERDEDYYDRAVKLWDAGDFFEYYHLILEWTYITNALNHVKDRL
ncbi:hypothetical protein STCU_08321 [Strigomonas culicis]|nr:hypothetical protein STCU_08321 [Strigomonas culicis]|eukprot:EPY22158.1 hypothetical protein STCU_08321 [Strigomonas culicis]